MTKRMLVDGFHAEEIRVAIIDDKTLLEFDIETSSKKQTKGNIYLAKVTRVEPSLQAAFLEYGSGRQAFLPFSEIHPDYYQIPLADRQALLQEEEEADAAEAEAPASNDNSDDQATEIAEAAITEAVLTENADQLEAHEHTDDSAEDEMEDLGGDDIHEVQPKRIKSRRYKIQEVIKKNQIILIQVIKEERGNKGASVTSYISLAGRYCVLMPNSTKGGGVSRKVNDNAERKRLKELLGSLEMNKGMSLIMRTNGVGRSKADITRDYNYLTRLWNQIRKDTLASVAPALIFEEANVITRCLRDQYQTEFEEVVVSGEDSFKIARDFMKMIMPTHAKKVVKHEDKKPLFQKYGVEQYLSNMFDPIVTMPSGGYIVINATEALISIDVNSGRSTGERNVEDMATAINIEAAQEVARQLRLRDLAGLVVIDFIDMMGMRNKRQVENALKTALKSDRAKIQVGRISPFGLLEMSRQRLRSSLTEMNMIECPACKGTGIIRSPDSAMVQILRAIETELAQSPLPVAKLIVTTTAELALHFLNNKRGRIAELEAEHKFSLIVETEHLPPATFKIQLEWEDGNRSRIFSSDEREGRLPQSLEGGKPKRRRGGRKNKGEREERIVEQYDRNEQNSDESPEFDADFDSTNESSDNVTSVETEGEGNKRRRNRNRRDRNWRNRRDGNPDKPAGTETTAETGEKATGAIAQLTESVEKAIEKTVAVEQDFVGIIDEIVSDYSSGEKTKRGRKPAASKAKKKSAEVSISTETKAELAVVSSKTAQAQAELPPANVIIDESTAPKKKSSRGGWWKKVVEQV